MKNNEDDDDGGNDEDPNSKTSNQNYSLSILPPFECKCDLQCAEIISAWGVL